YPTTGTLACCARAASGRRAAPPRRPMNSRRRMAAPSVGSPPYHIFSRNVRDLVHLPARFTRIGRRSSAPEVFLLHLREETLALDLIEQARVDVILEFAAAARELGENVLGALLRRLEVGRGLRLEIVVSDVKDAAAGAVQLFRQRLLRARGVGEREVVALD